MRAVGGAAAVSATLITVVLFFIPMPIGRVLEDGTRELALPILRFFVWISNQTKTDAEMEIQRLKIQIQRLKMENALLSGLQQENNRLRKMLRFVEESKFIFLPAQVIARSSPSWWGKVTIDRGSADGVSEGMVVVSMQGLVGIVKSTTPGSAEVLLLGDEQVRIAATIESTDQQGIIVGVSSASSVGKMKLTFVSKSSTSPVGKRVITSGLGGVYPAGLLIGTITSRVDTRDEGGFGLFEEYHVQPIAELTNLSDVFVVVGTKQES